MRINIYIGSTVSAIYNICVCQPWVKAPHVSGVADTKLPRFFSRYFVSYLYKIRLGVLPQDILHGIELSFTALRSQGPGILYFLHLFLLSSVFIYLFLPTLPFLFSFSSAWFGPFLRVHVIYCFQKGSKVTV